ncbi:4-hydroxy-tetrahydrodipicolinate reductase [Marinoscillum sp. MHG1-6]|uniref:4-hydroxy-tetrahydrodipicolinate reductase n=1 Tax=Marinoscillum sp. MHG1-6 TaxID=2959627 RepID=UPI0021574503|nr:4-hydroxy-tetrahydrodipicolinate reductase [Marinoscillum sp. MHG1-6]
MRIALVGYGKMGKAIEALAQAAGHEISFIIDADNTQDINNISPENTDVAIEFSQPSSAYQNIKTLLSNRVKTMVGTTGWLDQYEEMAALCNSNNGTFLYASNYSIGVNLFFELNKWLAEKMASLSDFKAEMEEIHHTEKKDAPSGTAITLAEGVIEKNQSISKWVNEETDAADAIGIISLREPGVPGTHTIKYDSPLESIEIKHTAHDRKVFASGVIKVAEWFTNQSGVLTMADFLKQS